MKTTLVEQLAPELALMQYNEIPVLELRHSKGNAKIALQGAQLLSWQPTHTAQDVLWLSEIEAFKQGEAIRGGVPICFPWFGGAGKPSHGYARISLWTLAHFQIQPEKARLEFELFHQDQLEARVVMLFGDECEIQFYNLAVKDAQLALHSYFNLGDIGQTELHNLPTTVFNSLTKQTETVPSPRLIAENVDCIYSSELGATNIQDNALNRQIKVEHINASDIVVWNPWHKVTSSMSDVGYKTMVCVETARINQTLNNEVMSVKFSVK